MVSQMAEFVNPNTPPQPQKGVYVWTAHKDGERVSLYVGRAGQTERVQPKGTLLRGVCELYRHTFCSETSYRKLDTDFIVRTAVMFFEKRGFRCTWEHVSDDPTEEGKFTRRLKPILQNTRSHLHDALRCTASEPGFWKLSGKASTEEGRELFGLAGLQVEEVIEGLLRSRTRG